MPDDRNAFINMQYRRLCGEVLRQAAYDWRKLCSAHGWLVHSVESSASKQPIMLSELTVFLESEYCEWMCEAVGINYALYRGTLEAVLEDAKTKYNEERRMRHL